MKSLLILGVVSLGIAAAACSSSPSEDDASEEEVGVTQEELQGGCSMAEIRGWQRACRAAYGSTDGIHYCYPGMSTRHMNCEGACACN